MSTLTAEKAKGLRYKRPIASGMNLFTIRDELDEMREACDEIKWFESDEENLVAALDGDEDEAYEFRMAFADLCAELEQFYTDLNGAIRNTLTNCFLPSKHEGLAATLALTSTKEIISGSSLMRTPGRKMKPKNGS